MSSIFYKQPREVFDYFIDMKEYFKEYIGDKIEFASDIQVEISPTGELTSNGVILNNSGVDGFTVWLSGGINGGRYKVTFLIDTKEGRTEEAEMELRIREV
jgi:hypothetical protein